MFKYYNTSNFTCSLATIFSYLTYFLLYNLWSEKRHICLYARDTLCLRHQNHALCSLRIINKAIIIMPHMPHSPQTHNQYSLVVFLYINLLLLYLMSTISGDNEMKYYFHMHTQNYFSMGNKINVQNLYLYTSTSSNATSSSTTTSCCLSSPPLTTQCHHVSTTTKTILW